MPLHLGYPCARPGRPGAAETCEPRQVREEATVRRSFWVPPVSCPDIFAPIAVRSALWQNTPMSRWIQFIFAILVGLGLGLLYGWVISPVEYVDTTPDSLDPAYKADYVLMTAEIYQAERDPDLAARRLARLGSQPPLEIATQALTYARLAGYGTPDLRQMEDLIAALRTWNPNPGGAP